MPVPGQIGKGLVIPLDGSEDAPNLPRPLLEAVNGHFSDPATREQAVRALADLSASPAPDRLEIFHSYAWILIVSFLVTLCVTPVMRRLAVSHGVIDRPSEARKVHRLPIAYLGGAAVFLGIMGGVMYALMATAFPGLMAFHPSEHIDTEAGSTEAGVHWSILLGMTVIAVLGLIDDVTGISPRVKIAGQLFAAAALAASNIGVRVAAGALLPIAEKLGVPLTTLPDGVQTILFEIPLPVAIGGFGAIPVDVVYWLGTAIIAVFVIGACNASNLVDGLDGLLTGTTAITTCGLLVLSLGLAAMDDGPLDAQRLILCMALLGACLGFLPHNFNPATIFLGDCGSLLLGFTTIVIILTLGDTGKTQYVFAGLMMYAIPIIDTSLAIVRRKMAGKRISDPDSDHLHHMLKRALGVKGAVFTLYAIAMGFVALGVAMSMSRVRVVYTLALIFASYIAVIAIKIARKKQIEEQAAAYDAGVRRPPGPPSPATAPPPPDRSAQSPTPAPIAQPVTAHAEGA